MAPLPPRTPQDILQLLDNAGLNDGFILDGLRRLGDGHTEFSRGIHQPTMFRSLLLLASMRRLIGHDAEQIGTQIMIVLPSDPQNNQPTLLHQERQMAISATLTAPNNPAQTLNKLLGNPEHITNNKRAKPRPKPKKRTRDL